MKHFVSIILLLIATALSAWSEIVAAEYYLGVDPGEGNGTAMAVVPVGLTLAFRPEELPENIKVGEQLELILPGFEEVVHGVEAGPMLIEKGKVRIAVRRNTQDTTIVLSDHEELDLFKDGWSHFMPMLNTDSAGNLIYDLNFKERQRSLTESFEYFPKTVKIFFQYFTPIGSFTLVSNLSTLHQLGYAMILLGFLNLLPIPGLALGNTCIALIETIRKKKFNPKLIRNLRYICIGIISLFLIFLALDSL